MRQFRTCSMNGRSSSLMCESSHSRMNAAGEMLRDHLDDPALELPMDSRMLLNARVGRALHQRFFGVEVGSRVAEDSIEPRIDRRALVAEHTVGVQVVDQVVESPVLGVNFDFAPSGVAYRQGFLPPCVGPPRPRLLVSRSASPMAMRSTPAETSGVGMPTRARVSSGAWIPTLFSGRSPKSTRSCRQTNSQTRLRARRGRSWSTPPVQQSKTQGRD